MLRILDLDTDFFSHEVVHWPDLSTRPNDDDHPVWELDEVRAFLEVRCGLRGKLPGRAVTTHDAVFPLWRTAIEAGLLTAPFHVTHVDAHGDLGFGDASYIYLMTELLHLAPEERWYPRTGDLGLAESNYLAFAIACRWIHSVDYVFCPGGGDDLFPYYKERFALGADALQLAALSADELELLKRIFPEQNADQLDRFRASLGTRLEPVVVPVHQLRADDFQADAPFDAMFLAQSPGYVPPGADIIFQRIREWFLDEEADVGTIGATCS